MIALAVIVLIGLIVLVVAIISVATNDVAQGRYESIRPSNASQWRVCERTWPASNAAIPMPPVLPPRPPRHRPTEDQVDAAQAYIEELLGRPLPPTDVPRFREHVRSALAQSPL